MLDTDIIVDPELDSVSGHQKRRHVRCASQVGLDVRQMLCGFIIAGPRKKTGKLPHCQECFDAKAVHQASCSACIARWGHRR